VISDLNFIYISTQSLTYRRGGRSAQPIFRTKRTYLLAVSVEIRLVPNKADTAYEHRAALSSLARRRGSTNRRQGPETTRRYRHNDSTEPARG
jgi:hypothetical protein